jgi:hypothetical protein
MKQKLLAADVVVFLCLCQCETVLKDTLLGSYLGLEKMKYGRGVGEDIMS